jgi:hypothetical protein
MRAGADPAIIAAVGTVTKTEHGFIIDTDGSLWTHRGLSGDLVASKNSA